MDCLLAICIQITAQLGLQSGFEMNQGVWHPKYSTGNEYGAMIGRFDVIVEHDQFYAAGSHLSGVSVSEGDMGLNFISLGRIKRWGPLYIRGGAGIQSYSKDGTNEYGFLIIEKAVGFEWRILMAECSQIDDMFSCAGGIKADL